MIDAEYVSYSPLQRLKGLNIKLDPRHVRRAIEPDQLRRLLEVTAAGPRRFGMSGLNRSRVYRVATETGLRANEMRTLTKSSFDLEAKTTQLYE